MIEPDPLWDFDDPVASETRLRAAAGACDEADRPAWLTQVARAVGLQGRYDEGHALLDSLPSAGADPELAVRTALERGRLLRSGGDPEGARPCFDDATRAARAAGLDALLVDALHMVALVAGPQEAPAVLEEALAVARDSSEQRARDWDASLLTNRGMGRADAGDFAAALADFEEALAARRRIGDVGGVRVARWMVAWAQRNLGRREEALAAQLALRAELMAAGEHDPYVDEEIALLEG